MPVTRSLPGPFGWQDSDNGGLSTGAKAGIGVGVSVGCILILLTLGIFIIRRRKQRRHDQHQHQHKNSPQDMSSLDEETPESTHEKIELPVNGRTLACQLPELSSNGPQSLYTPTSPTDSVQGRVELPAPESSASTLTRSRAGTDTAQSPRSPGAGSTVRYSHTELEGHHQVPELAPSPLFSKELSIAR